MSSVVLGAGTVADVTWNDDTVVRQAVKSHQTLAALEDLVAHAPPATPVVCVAEPSGERGGGAAALRRHVRLLRDGCPAPTSRRGWWWRSLPARPGCSTSEAWKRRKLLLSLGNGVDPAAVPGDAEELVRNARAEGEPVLAALGLPCVSAEEDRRRRGDHVRRCDDVGDEVVLLGCLHEVPTPVHAAVRALTRRLATSEGRPRSVDAATVRTTPPTDDEGPATSR